MRIALRTQQVIAHETGVVNTIDPLGGSYYLEQLTNELERQAYDYFDRIEKLGGVVAAIKENFFQREIAEASFRYQSEVEARAADRRRRQPLPAGRRAADRRSSAIDPALETQADRARPGAPRRAATAPRSRPRSRGCATDAADDDRNLMPAIVDAARAYVTMGEMCDAFRDVWGTWRETPVF